MRKSRFLFAIFILPVVVLSLLLMNSAVQAQDNSEEAAKNLQQSAEELTKALQQMGQAMGNSEVEPVSFRELKKKFPQSFGPFNLTESSGESNSGFGVKISEATAIFENGSGGIIEIVYRDYGTMKGIMGMAMLGWTMNEFERETDSGYEKTTTYKDFKALEEYNYDYKSGKFNLFLGDRLGVEIDGSNVTEDDMKQARDSIPCDDLLGLIKTN